MGLKKCKEISVKKWRRIKEKRWQDALGGCKAMILRTAKRGNNQLLKLEEGEGNFEVISVQNGLLFLGFCFSSGFFGQTLIMIFYKQIEFRRRKETTPKFIAETSKFNILFKSVRTVKDHFPNIHF